MRPWLLALAAPLLFLWAAGAATAEPLPTPVTLLEAPGAAGQDQLRTSSTDLPPASDRGEKGANEGPLVVQVPPVSSTDKPFVIQEENEQDTSQAPSVLGEGGVPITGVLTARQADEERPVPEEVEGFSTDDPIVSLQDVAVPPSGEGVAINGDGTQPVSAPALALKDAREESISMEKADESTPMILKRAEDVLKDTTDQSQGDKVDLNPESDVKNEEHLSLLEVPQSTPLPLGRKKAEQHADIGVPLPLSPEATTPEAEPLSADSEAAEDALHKARQTLQRTLDQVLREAQEWAKTEGLGQEYEEEEEVDPDHPDPGLSQTEALSRTRADLQHTLEEMLTEAEQKALLEAIMAEKDGEEHEEIPGDEDDLASGVDTAGVDENRVPEDLPDSAPTTATSTSSTTLPFAPTSPTTPPAPTSTTTPPAPTSTTTPPAPTSTTTPPAPTSTTTPPAPTSTTTPSAPTSTTTPPAPTSTTTAPTTEPVSDTTTENSFHHLVAGLEKQGIPCEVVVPEDVVGSAVAAAKVLQAVQGAPDSDCPSAPPSPLRLPALPNMAPDSESAQCARDSRLLDRHLRNHTLWAVQMQDAGSGGISGLLEGNLYHLGDFDECMDVLGPVRAQYCVAEVHIHAPPRTPDHRHHPDFPLDPMQSVWNCIKHEGEAWRLPLDVLYVAVCAPAACDPRDLQDSIQRALDQHANSARLPVAYTVTVPEAFCTSAAKQRPPFTTGEIVYITIIVILVLFVCSGTLIDFFAAKKKGCMRSVLVLFSLRRSWHMLFKNDPRPMGLDLDALSGARTLNMLVLVLAHRGFNLLRGPVHNYNHFEAMPRHLLHTAATHAQLFVDTCFAMSGLLVALLELTKVHALATTASQKQSFNDRPNLMAAMVHRYVRLTPSYALVVFFYATIFWRFGSGPLWDQVIGHESEACAKYWWTNLFYVNNYVNTDKLCMFQSWYLPCDLHLFFIGTALTLLLARHRRTGLGFMIAFLGLSVLVPFFITLFGKKPALLEMLPSLFLAPDQSDNFRTMYAPTHIRAAPYVVGLLAGYLFQRLALRHKERFSQSVTWLLCLGGVALTTGSLLSSVVFYDPDMKYDGVVAGLYAALCPVVWSVGVCIVFASLVLGSPTPMSAFLSWKPFVVMSRLTYNVYLTHWAFQVASVAKARTPFHLDAYNVFYLSFGDMMASFLTSAALFLLVEAPFRSLARRITAPPPESKVHLEASIERGRQAALEAGFARAIPKENLGHPTKAGLSN